MCQYFLLVVDGETLSIPDSFDFDVASWEVGTFRDCSALSEALQPFGGFPSTLFVREEMKEVWSILLDGLINKSKWVLVGSPGVGKSILAVLLSFHIAKNFKKPVFLARLTKGLNGETAGEKAICISPGGVAEGYPKLPDDVIDLRGLRQTFGRANPDSSRVIVVLDGWAQSEIVGDIKKGFNGFDLLASSAQYASKSDDPHQLVLLPAWKSQDLTVLWENYEAKDTSVTFEEQLYYSGGSVRDLYRPLEVVRNRIDANMEGITEETCKALLAQYGGSSGSGMDRLRRCYVIGKGPKSYLKVREWSYVVDSGYALNRISAKAPLDVYLRSLNVAQGCGQSHYGWAFEAFVHQLFRVSNIIVTLHMKGYTRPGTSSDAFVNIRFDKNMIVDCFGTCEEDVYEYLRTRTIDEERASYWHPDYPLFPAIDGIVYLPKIKTVFYLNMSVAEKFKNVDSGNLLKVHEKVKESVNRIFGCTTDWNFGYIVIEPSLESSDALEVKLDGKLLLAKNVGEVTISKGYVTYV